MQTVGSQEAEAHLPVLLDLVAQGEEITITRDGVPVAKLVPAEESRQAEIRETIQKMLESRKNWPLNGLSIREMIEEGRK